MAIGWNLLSYGNNCKIKNQCLVYHDEFLLIWLTFIDIQNKFSCKCEILSAKCHWEAKLDSFGTHKNGIIDNYREIVLRRNFG